MNSCRPSRLTRPTITPGVADLQRLMRPNCRAYVREAETSERIEVIQAASDRKDRIGTLADYVISEEHPTEEECPISAERTVTMSQTRLRAAIAGSSGLIEDAVTILVTPKATMES